MDHVDAYVQLALACNGAEGDGGCDPGGGHGEDGEADAGEDVLLPWWKWHS